MKAIIFSGLKFFSIVLTLFFSGSVFSNQWIEINQCIERKMDGDFINIIKIKPKCANLKIVGSNFSDKGMTTLEFAKKYKVDVAVNANFSRRDETNSVIGAVVSDGVTWPGSSDSMNETMFSCDQFNNCDIESLGLKSDIPKNSVIVVSGWQNYDNGKFSCPPKAIEGCFKHNGGERHPRTAIGIGKDENIYLVTVDGRQPTFDGVTLAEFDEVMKKYSILRALNLDGGGSTTLVINGIRVNNLPKNQKIERTVPNHIGFVVNR